MKRRNSVLARHGCQLRPHRVLFRILTFITLLGVGAADAAEQSRASGRFDLDLLPNSFRRNPTISLTVYTDVTDYGRTLPEVSPERPSYYIAHSSGFRAMGYAVGGETPPVPEEFQVIVNKALAARGFLPSPDDSQPPTLALMVVWGSHHAMDPELASMFPELQRKYTIERAALVGGRDYARRVHELFEYGPRASDRGEEQRQLLHQASSDLYYVVVSAYSAADLANDERQLAWRTTMTVNASGVSMRQTLPPLVVSAGEFLGRAMNEPISLRRAVGRDSVSFGPLEVLEEDVPSPTPDAPEE